MKPALSGRKPRYPSNWESLPAGNDLKDIIEHALDDVSRQIFGYHFLKLGSLSSELSLSHSPIKHIFSMTEELGLDNAAIVGKSQDLPFQENSIDAVLLAHEMDFSQDPHQVLREVNRVITPNGHVIIVGFSPFSPAGLLRFFPINPKQILHEARFFSSVRIKDWLHLLGFEVVNHQRLIFSELFFERRVHEDSRWQRWCQKYLPVFSTVYVIVAKKRVMPLSLVRPKWKPKPNFTAVGASMRIDSSSRMKKNLL
ncbi:class I SAM-dependent methyltransferase [Aestuariibacter sp. AA17]|uniref:Class I SAM-dependent methyltransferase n=1 Tax=Fluctibacter corallii TaxID=2984329 RepID=A0ABT3A8X1_9ALTE|nr:class I SAM-dependent methyltransferase [Aestuariibacter sp. AA17]MCV2885131.1 class I SAM-dependent methyltransferase [Aestuariibacter sp. AA17]